MRWGEFRRSAGCSARIQQARAQAFRSPLCIRSLVLGRRALVGFLVVVGEPVPLQGESLHDVLRPNADPSDPLFEADFALTYMLKPCTCVLGGGVEAMVVRQRFWASRRAPGGTSTGSAGQQCFRLIKGASPKARKASSRAGNAPRTLFWRPQRFYASPHCFLFESTKF